MVYNLRPRVNDTSSVHHKHSIYNKSEQQSKATRRYIKLLEKEVTEMNIKSFKQNRKYNHLYAQYLVQQNLIRNLHSNQVSLLTKLRLMGWTKDEETINATIQSSIINKETENSPSCEHSN